VEHPGQQRFNLLNGPYQLMRPERRRTSIPTPKAAMTAKILPSSTLPAVNCNAEHAANIRAAAANNSCGMSFFPIRTVYSLTVGMLACTTKVAIR
jgi:hypothetical protein